MPESPASPPLPPESPATLALETSLRVPGLGVLAVPTAEAAAGLAAYALHTALSVTLLVASQPPQALTGTVEELTRDGQLPRRTLLLDFDPVGPLPAGACLRLHAILPPLF